MSAPEARPVKGEEKSRRHHATGAGARIGGDHPSLQVIVVVGVIGVALSSFAISFTSLLAVAAWQETPQQIHFLTALEIDLPVIVFTVATIIFKHREQRMPMWLCRVLAFITTAISAGANFLHTVSIRGLDDYTDWIGALFNAFAPVLVLFCTEILGAMLTRPKAKDSALAKARAENVKLRAELKDARNRARRLAPSAVTS